MTSVRGDHEDTGREWALRSASAVFDQLLEAVDGLPPRAEGSDDGPREPVPPPGARSRRADPSLTELRAAVARSMDLYSDLLQQVLALYAESIQGLLDQRAARSGSTDGPIELDAHAGSTARARLWVHNATAESLRAVRLRLTDLSAHDGSRLADVAAFEPAEVDVPAGGSAASWLEVLVPDGVTPAAYHGYVLAAGLPDAAVGVRLVVAP